MKKNSSNTNIFFRECIAQALTTLLQKKSLSNISITELTKVAGVSRMTYYRNFSSKEDIIHSYFDIILQRYEETEPAHLTQGTYCDTEHMVHYFSYVLEYRSFLDAITSSAYGYIFCDVLTDYIIKKWLTDENDKMQRYRLCAFAGALYNLYVGWSKNNYQESPKQMAQIAFSLLYLAP